MKYYRISEWQLGKLEGALKEEDSEQAHLIAQAIRHDEVEAPPPVVIATPFIVDPPIEEIPTEYLDASVYQGRLEPLYEVPPAKEMSPKEYGMSLRKKHKKKK